MSVTHDVYIPASVRKAELDKKIGAARDEAFKEKCRLQNLINEYPQTLVRVVESIDRLIDAKVTLALLERGS